MKRKMSIVATFLVAFSCAVVSSVQAQSSDSHPIVGTWKLNLERSSFDPGSGPQSVVRSFTEGDDGFITSIRITQGGQGNVTFAMVRLKLDGQDYEVWTSPGLNEFLSSGTRPPNTGAFTRIDDNTLELLQKNGGTPGALSPNRWAVSSDGSTLTVTTSGTAPDGTVVNNVEVFDRVN